MEVKNINALVSEKCYSQDAVWQLYTQASAYAKEGTKWTRASWLRRDIDASTAKAAQNEKKLCVRPKDSNGHKQSPINGKISGVFLQIWDRHGGPSVSIYADRKLLIPVKSIIRAQEHNLYFADFYCQNVKQKENRKIHYVILVICRAESKEDNFCKEHLVPLIWSNNPFVVARSNGSMFSKGNQKKAWYLVHVFFAHEVSLRGINCWWTHVKINGGGQQTLEVNEDCAHCKLPDSPTERYSKSA